MPVARACVCCAYNDCWSNSVDSYGNVKLTDYYCAYHKDFICRDCCIAHCPLGYWDENDPYHLDDGSPAIPVACGVLHDPDWRKRHNIQI